MSVCRAGHTELGSCDDVLDHEGPHSRLPSDGFRVYWYDRDCPCRQCQNQRGEKETKMTQPKKGDRVRVTWEGVYDAWLAGGKYHLVYGQTEEGLFTAPADAVIEILAPALPEEPAPWSIVSDADGDAWQRGSMNPLWMLVGNGEMKLKWSDLCREYGPLTVLREGRGQ